MLLVELTGHNDDRILVNFDTVAEIIEKGDHCLLAFVTADGQEDQVCRKVQESFEEILEKLPEGSVT